MSKKTCAFQAEVRQLLDIVVHSLYSKKEIFLRELISNASDAVDRAQYEGLTNKTLVADAPTWEIYIRMDKPARTLTIEDNGVGMDAATIESCLGTIARSGTKAFVEAAKAQAGANAPESIGQFGVGFYSAFMVADQVTVDSLARGPNTTAVRWTSAGDGVYTLSDGARATPGTAVTIHLREGLDEFLDEWHVRGLVKQHSDFIAYPIRFVDMAKPPAVAPAPVNTMRALWKRSKSEISEAEYREFYQHLAHDRHDPLKTIHVAAEGAVEFRALLFLPPEPTIDMLMHTGPRRAGLQLYVRNVFIGSDFEALLPEYLRFVRGVVESSDLPLNVSREMLQDDVVIRKIRSNLVSKVLATLAEMKRDETEAYLKFFRAFGRILKEGFHFDHDNEAKLKDLVLFSSANTAGGGLISLRQYRDAMPSKQTEIYYLIAEDLPTARQSPQLEAVQRHGCDVLLFVDPIDAWVAEELENYDGCKLRAIDQGDLDLGTAEEQTQAKQQREEADKNLRPLLDFMQSKLSGDISAVRLSTRLTDSPCCLVASTGRMNPSMERMMRAMNQDVPKETRILEVNASHPLLARMQQMFAANREDPRLADYVEMLHGQALLAEGASPKDPRKFTKLVADMMTNSP
ncbi:MAG: molecular chaperone HtpG [Kiritimatiellia bacterium]